MGWGRILLLSVVTHQDTLRGSVTDFHRDHLCLLRLMDKYHSIFKLIVHQQSNPTL